MATPTQTPANDREHRSVAEHVDRWEAESLLTHEQAEAIRAYERTEAEEPVGRIPLVTEMIGYVGVALVAAALFTLLGRVWGDLSSGAQLAILGAGVLVFLAAGWSIHTSDEPALQRLSSVLWTVSVGCLFGFMLTLLFTREEVEEAAAWAVFALGSVVGLYSRVLLSLRTSSLLQTVLFAGTLTALAGIGVWGIEEGWDALDRVAPSVFAATIVALSALWIAAGRSGVLKPRFTAYALGAAAAVYAPVLALQDSVGAGLIAGVVVSAAALGAAVWLRSVPALAVGAIGLFGYVTGCAVYFLADTAGTPVALLISGLVFVGVALLTVRLRRFTRRT